MEIPYNRLYLTGRELEYVKDALDRGSISGDGHYTKLVNGFFEKRFGARKAIMTTSCTQALEFACSLCKIKPGDEVIMPSFTFVSTANPVVLRGAKPVFAEISPDTLNLDPSDVRKKVTKRTKAIIAVHYAGVSAPMDEIMKLAEEKGIRVIEDAAHAVNSKYKRKYLGTVGDFGCFSFHESKNVVCGEGGELLINTDDKKIHEEAEIKKDKGTDRGRFLRGETNKYTWVSEGSSYGQSDILAAFLIAQLEGLEDIQARRMRVYDEYDRALKPFEDAGILKRPYVPSYATHNAHIYRILLNTGEERDRMIMELKMRGIQSLFHYISLHSSPMGRSMGYKIDDLPITNDISSRILRLPLFAGMGEDEMEYAVANIIEALEVTDGR